MFGYRSQIARAISLTGLIAGFVALSLAFQVGAQELVEQDQDPALKNIDIVERLGEQVPLDIVFTDDHGRTQTLGEALEPGKPVLLTLAYYECPMLCNLVLNGLSASLGDVEWNASEQFNLLTVSIKPSETVELAAAKKKNYLEYFTELSGRDFAPAGWTFAVAEKEQSEALAEAVGFKYYLDKNTGEYAHPAMTVVLTDEGVISRYLYGIDHEQRNLKLALLEASEGRVGTVMDRLLLYCYRYDPDEKGYVMFAANVMKLGGALTVVLLGLFLGGLWLKERSRKAQMRTA